MINKDKLKILLIQARNDEVTLKEERESFIKLSQLRSKQFTSFNVAGKINFDSMMVLNYDAVLVGGSSDVSARLPNKFKFIPSLEKLLHIAVNNNIPILASCYGFQTLVAAYGGTVIEDKKNMEMGTYNIALTTAGEKDKLFGQLPNNFLAVSGHKERAVKLPNNFILLASSRLCPYHAFKIKNKLVWGTQFHPEVSRKILIDRITRYKKRYLEEDKHLEQIKNTAQETDEANSLIEKFFNYISSN